MDLSAFDRDGFVIVPDVLDPTAVASLRREYASLEASRAAERHAGLRNLLQESAAVAATASGPAVSRLVTAVLGPGAFPVRALFFDKTPQANWKVPWHQDLAIAVAEKVDAEGFTGWSVKDDVPHVHPPVTVLERMLTVRIHLDDCGEENGPLRVLPGSHRQGRLGPDAIGDWKAHARETICKAPSGSGLLMRPLILHASSTARQPGHRRVLHLEFAAEPLLGRLRWAGAPDRPGK
ncbi:MAG TPA: phytanoyl-CoA dioxygenase family protein [Candidatus Limnocylindria bacterium]|nr:phytanoyl-CoA dioxygenase family protein [Candidatus Limnocylindria bacterium]